MLIQSKLHYPDIMCAQDNYQALRMGEEPGPKEEYNFTRHLAALERAAHFHV